MEAIPRKYCHSLVLWKVRIELQKRFEISFFVCFSKLFFLDYSPSLTMPPSETIAQDIELAAMVPLAALALMLFWMVIYVLFEEGGRYFDETFTDGVIVDELKSWRGVIDNIAAQSTWRCVMLCVAHLICTAYPMSAAAIYAGGLFKKMTSAKLASTLDLVGTGMAGILFLIGVYETIFDDNNGVGLFHLVNGTVLLIFTLPRVLQKGEPDTPHVLMGRPCYHQIEPAKEQELSETQQDVGATDGKDVV